MNIRCFGYCFILAMGWAFDASAQPRIDDDPFDARYTIRGIEPSDYLGFGDYANEVLSLALPQTSNANDKENTHVGLSGFTVTTTAALHFWEVRRLRVRTRLSFPGAESTEIHLTWPTNVHVLEETFPFKTIRQAFERSNLRPDSPEWISQRNRLWPDPASMATKIATDRLLNISSCPQLLTRLRQLRDDPPALELIPRLVNLADAPTGNLMVASDGWGITLLLNGGPNQYNGGLYTPDQTSELGQALLKLVGDAEVCAGLERSLP
jgi:hypothetical protein